MNASADILPTLTFSLEFLQTERNEKRKSVFLIAIITVVKRLQF